MVSIHYVRPSYVDQVHLRQSNTYIHTQTETKTERERERERERGEKGRFLVYCFRIIYTKLLPKYKYYTSHTVKRDPPLLLSLIRLSPSPPLPLSLTLSPSHSLPLSLVCAPIVRQRDGPTPSNVDLSSASSTGTYAASKRVQLNDCSQGSPCRKAF